MQILKIPSGEIIDIDFEMIGYLINRDTAIDINRKDKKEMLDIEWDEHYKMWSIKDEKTKLFNRLMLLV